MVALSQGAFARFGGRHDNDLNRKETIRTTLTTLSMTA